MTGPWIVAQAVAQRNGLDPLIVYTHASAHHDASPLQRRWADQCEIAALCLLEGERPHRALLEVTQ
jgi:hypothetical protein